MVVDFAAHCGADPKAGRVKGHPGAEPGAEEMLTAQWIPRNRKSEEETAPACVACLRPELRARLQSEPALRGPAAVGQAQAPQRKEGRPTVAPGPCAASNHGAPSHSSSAFQSSVFTESRWAQLSRDKCWYPKALPSGSGKSPVAPLTNLFPPY